MKKITLSAAVLALAMMGCSDAGLDNSVASTNEVKNVSQNAALLAKSGNYYFPNIDQPHAEQRELSQSYTHTFTIPRKAEFHFQMNSSYATVNGRMQAVGECSLSSPTAGYRAPDSLRVLTLPLYDCSVDKNPPHNTVSCRNEGFYPELNRNYLQFKQLPNVNSIRVEAPTNTIVKYEDRRNSITYCIAFWNPGKPNQTILAGTVFGGVQFNNNMYMAHKAYSQYFLPAIDDWIAKHPVH